MVAYKLLDRLMFLTLQEHNGKAHFEGTPGQWKLVYTADKTWEALKKLKDAAHFNHIWKL